MRTLLLASVTLLSACNDCSFWERCDGNTLLVCGEGVDQQVGREVHEVTCAAPNPVCQEVDEDHASCVADPASTCDATTYTPTCTGPVLSSCPSDVGYVVATDCALTYGTDCEEDDQGARCVGG